MNSTPKQSIPSLLVVKEAQTIVQFFFEALEKKRVPISDTQSLLCNKRVIKDAIHCLLDSEGDIIKCSALMMTYLALTEFQCLADCGTQQEIERIVHDESEALRRELRLHESH